MAIMTLDVWF